MKNLEAEYDNFLKVDILSYFTTSYLHLFCLSTTYSNPISNFLAVQNPLMSGKRDLGTRLCWSFNIHSPKRQHNFIIGIQL